MSKRCYAGLCAKILIPWSTVIAAPLMGHGCQRGHMLHQALDTHHHRSDSDLCLMRRLGAAHKGISNTGSSLRVRLTPAYRRTTTSPGAELWSPNELGGAG